MPPQEHVNENLPAYALGILEEEERKQVERHLEVCSACRAELDAYQEVTLSLAATVPTLQPPPSLEERIISQAAANPVRAAPSTRAVRGASSLPHKAPGFQQVLQKWLPVWSAVSFVLLVVLVAGNLFLWGQVRRLSQNQPDLFSTVALKPSEVNPEASGLLVISPDGRYGTLVVNALPDLPDDQQYQLWLIKDGKRTNGGVFVVGRGGYAAMEIFSKEPLSTFQGFGVTIEPFGGSPGPTGKRVLGTDV